VQIEIHACKKRDSSVVDRWYVKKKGAKGRKDGKNILQRYQARRTSRRLGGHWGASKDSEDVCAGYEMDVSNEKGRSQKAERQDTTVIEMA